MLLASRQQPVADSLREVSCMEFRPILSAMLRNKTGAFLVGLQIALTLAVIANAVFIIMQRVEKIGRPSGIDSANLIFVQSNGFGPDYNHLDTVRRDLDVLRSIPGVVSASSMSGMPMSGVGRSSNYGVTPDPLKHQTNVNTFDVDQNIIASLGVKLLEGRTFNEQEMQYNPNESNSDFVPSVIITQDVAKALFGDQPALGKTIYDGLGHSAVVIGIIENMLAAWVDYEHQAHVMLL